jgi:pimeloyl-ACP methyl ester carboxylesterase
MAEDTVELMRQLEVESAVVVGYSDGGIIGLDIAIHHPERVTRLAVTGAQSHVDGYTWTPEADVDCGAELHSRATTRHQGTDVDHHRR